MKLMSLILIVSLHPWRTWKNGLVVGYSLSFLFVSLSLCLSCHLTICLLISIYSENSSQVFLLIVHEAHIAPWKCMSHVKTLFPVSIQNSSRSAIENEHLNKLHHQKKSNLDT